MLLCGAVARYMIKDKIAGNIIFITSSRGERSYADDFIYGLTKAAIRRACESIAIDLSPHKIRVNCVAPGATWTNEGAAYETLKNGGIPMGRLGTPEDTANVVSFLILDQAYMITGFQLRTDGGLILSGLPEGCADAKFINPTWVQENYDKVMHEYFAE
ncbi:MAG: SDR family oxidoreductase [Candidatus Choladocola sp.]|nr:SDR family oxidoreductase [Candidatus Choladocola sp.]